MNRAASQAAASHAARLAVLVRVWPKLSETFILEEVLALERRGVDVRLYTLDAPRHEPRHAEVDHVRAVITPVLALPPLRAVATQAKLVGTHLAAHAELAFTHPFGWLSAVALAAQRGRAGWHDFARAAWLARQLRRDGAKRLHVHFIAEPADLAQMACRMAQLPMSISAHAKDIYLSRPEDLRRRLLAATFTVTCTEFNRATLAAVAPQAEVHRMYHGIDHGLFSRLLPAADTNSDINSDINTNTNTPPGCTHLLAVGRLRQKKGFDVLIDACALLVGRGRAISCDIVGYGDAEAALEKRIAEKGLQHVVHLRGKLARHDVLACYRSADVFVQPSRVMADGDRDGIPNVMLEAMSMRLPVVATRVSGIPEVVEHGRNGLLVGPDDCHALADAIERVLDDPALATELGTRARATVQRHFDNNTNLALLLRLMEGDNHACQHARVA